MEKDCKKSENKNRKRFENSFTLLMKIFFGLVYFSFPLSFVSFTFHIYLILIIIIQVVFLYCHYIIEFEKQYLKKKTECIHKFLLKRK